MYKVIICVPYYNNIKVLKRLLHSIEQQSVKDKQVVVTADNEDEEAERLVKSYGYIYINNPCRLGATANCNKAIRVAQDIGTQFIKVMHHDDYFTSNDSLERFVQMLESQPEADFAFCGSIQDNGVSCYERCISDEEVFLLDNDYTYLMKANVIGAPSAVIVRNKKIYMDEHLAWLVDVDWYIKFLHNNSKFVYTKQALVSIGVSEGQLTNTCINNRKLVLGEYLYLGYKLLKRKYEPKLDAMCECLAEAIDVRSFFEYDLDIVRDCVRDQKEVIIWGIGDNATKRLYPWLKEMGANVVAFCDTKEIDNDTIIVEDVRYRKLDSIEENSKALFLISCEEEYEEIRDILRNAGMNFFNYEYSRNICGRE